MPDVIHRGVDTIRWGTRPNGADTLSEMAGAIVESMDRKPKIDKPEIEDGDGFTVSAPLIDNGFDATIKCVYDSTIAWPTVGQALTLVTALFQDGVLVWCVEVTDDAARKKENMVTIEVQYRPRMAVNV